MAKRQPHMSAAPSYIVYGHRHAVRLVTRLIAIGLLLAAIVTVFAVIVWRARLRQARCGGSGGSPRRRRDDLATVQHTRTRPERPTARSRTSRPPSTPASKPKSHKPAKPIPLPGKTPVMVLNSNGIHGVAHQLAARVQGAGYPITYVGNAQKRGLPTIVQYAKGYGPAARKLARLRRQRAVRDPLRRHHAVAGQGREARRHPRHVSRSRGRSARSVAGVAGRDDSASVPREDRVVARRARARGRGSSAPAGVVPAVALVARERQPGAVVLRAPARAHGRRRARASAGRPSGCSRLARSSWASTDVRSRAAARSASTRASSRRPWVSSRSARAERAVAQHGQRRRGSRRARRPSPPAPRGPAAARRRASDGAAARGAGDQHGDRVGEHRQRGLLPLPVDLVVQREGADARDAARAPRRARCRAGA